jgi:hypothetical protein
MTETTEFKTLLLHAGYSPSTWEPVDPVKYLVKGASSHDHDVHRKAIRPREHRNIIYACSPDDDGRAMTQAGEPIEDNTIVEFNFDSPKGLEADARSY